MMLAVSGLVGATAGVAAEKGNPMVVISTSLGDIKIEVFADKAPVSAKNFLDYVQAGYYDNTIFHRVIPGFMVQGGGLTSDMRDKREGQRSPIKNESSNGLKNDVGTLAMARTSVPDSATSQFFINVKNNDSLNAPNPDGYGYTVFGRVVAGTEVVDKIRAVQTGNKGGMQNVPLEPIIIKSATLAK
jgi:peptidyl-prolyl cis-trans isomerase A (cyclophilin A)